MSSVTPKFADGSDASTAVAIKPITRSTTDPSSLSPVTRHTPGRHRSPSPGQHHRPHSPVDRPSSSPWDSIQHRDASRHHGYGWNPDLPDPDDNILVFDPLLRLPARVDLRPRFDDYRIPVYDQGQLNSATGNALAGLVEYVRSKERNAVTPSQFRLSRLALYHAQREMDGNVAVDAGGQLRNGLKALSRRGAVDEASWPYDVAAGDVMSDGTFRQGSRAAQRPDVWMYRHVLDRDGGEGEPSRLRYCRVLQVRDNMRGCLAEGYPFVAGFSVLDGFESAEVEASGVVGTPGLLGGRPVGGHAVLVVGYDDAAHRFTCRNSWGPGWGDGGHFTMPYAYLCNPDLAGDFWTVRTSQSSITRRS